MGQLLRIACAMNSNTDAYKNVPVCTYIHYTKKLRILNILNFLCS